MKHLAIGLAFAVALGALLASGVTTAAAKESPKDKAAKPEPAQAGDTIAWLTDVAAAFEKAAARRLPVMICINASQVDGKARAEPAAKGLREVVYKDLRVVTKSRQFVCVYLTPEGSSKDYGELRLRFGIDGSIVSPQHIFAHPNHAQGNAPLARKEYWPHGKGEGAVDELLKMMDKALTKFGAREGSPETPAAPDAGDGGGAEAPMAPEDDAKRTAWIEKLLGIVRTGAEDPRQEALRSLIANDKRGDCIDPVIGLIEELKADKKAVPVLTDVVRALGVPELHKAALAMHGLLKHKDDGLRANTAVSLEYIGFAESVDPLKARVAREKVEPIANHMYRALGRCAAGDKKVRALLIKKSKGSKSELGAYGPIVGLAYFSKDDKAARAVEKLLKAMGPPGGGRRGGGRGTMKRGLLAWSLGEIEDPKSATFMRETMISALEHTVAFWKDAVIAYYDAVARKCEGDAEAAGAIDEGIRRTLEFSGGTAEIKDDARKGRDQSKFEPKADWDVEGRGFGGGRGNGKGGKGR